MSLHDFLAATDDPLTAFPPRPGMCADRRDLAHLLRVAAVGALAGWGAVAAVALIVWLLAGGGR